MARHGRKSENSLTVVPALVPGSGRPKPPRGLDALERRIWRDVIDALPSHWVDRAGAQILRRAVGLAALCERQEVRLRELQAAGAADSEEVIELAAAHGAMAKIVAALFNELRATPKSRMVSRAARSRTEDAPKIRPWEIKAREPA
jgi:hypothetical protein